MARSLSAFRRSVNNAMEGIVSSLARGEAEESESLSDGSTVKRRRPSAWDESSGSNPRCVSYEGTWEVVTKTVVAVYRTSIGFGGSSKRMAMPDRTCSTRRWSVMPWVRM